MRRLYGPADRTPRPRIRRGYVVSAPATVRSTSPAGRRHRRRRSRTPRGNPGQRGATIVAGRASWTACPSVVSPASSLTCACPCPAPAIATSGILVQNQLVKLGTSESTARKRRALTPAQVRSIEQCGTPDLIIIEINLGDAELPRWLDVRKISPGQKATAMLSLALVTGTHPVDHRPA